jgi:hypothetical protein
MNRKNGRLEGWKIGRMSDGVTRRYRKIRREHIEDASCEDDSVAAATKIAVTGYAVQARSLLAQVRESEQYLI